MLPNLRKGFSSTSVCQRWTPAGNFVQNWSRLSNYLMFLNIICYMHYLLLFMISLDHPCEIENGVLQYMYISFLRQLLYFTFFCFDDIYFFNLEKCKSTPSFHSRLDWISFFLDFWLYQDILMS